MYSLVGFDAESDKFRFGLRDYANPHASEKNARVIQLQYLLEWVDHGRSTAKTETTARDREFKKLLNIFITFMPIGDFI